MLPTYSQGIAVCLYDDDVDCLLFLLFFPFSVVFSDIVVPMGFFCGVAFLVFLLCSFTGFSYLSVLKFFFG